MERYSGESFVFHEFRSTKEAINKVLVALQDQSTRIVGLYGEPGSGKTTLVKEVGEQAKVLGMFDVVSFASIVSQNSHAVMMTIQDEIARSLNLWFDKSSTKGMRAGRIYARLKYNERVLMILDDVRVKIELEDIGIPFDDKRCKFLLTTCDQQECSRMDCQRRIQLHPLFREEAWSLFKEYSGIGDDESWCDKDILSRAREVAFECKGLPGKIKEVGSSLKYTSFDAWREPLSHLRLSLTKYQQIFLSFRGEDTRYSFTGSLHRALCQRGINAFIDDEGLKTGDLISQSLINAIEASRLSIVVLSENYASSSWCLDELVKILECMETKNQLVWPIFYKVDPSDIRHLKKSYGEAMVKHEHRYGYDSERIQKWKSALLQVSGLSGLHYRATGYEHDLIESIVEDANRVYVQSTDMD